MIAFLSLLLVPVALARNLSLTRPHAVLPRDGSSLFSNYNAGDSEGACGAWHQDSEYVVAFPQVQWDGGSHCNQEVYITYNGMSATAKIVDECEKCPYGGLDFSQSLFGHFVGGEQNNLDVGEIYGTYVFGSGPAGGGGDSGDDNDDTTTKKPAPPTTTTHKSTTTTHSTTTAHSTSTTTHISSVPVSPSQSPASAFHSSASISPSASASASPIAGTGPQNLQDFSQAILNLAGLLM